MDEAQAKALAEKLGAEFNKQLAQIEGQLKETGKVSEDTATQYKGLDEKISTVETALKSMGDKFSEMVVKQNRSQLPFGGDGADHIKNLQNQIYEQLEAGVKSGAISETGSGRKQFFMKDGHKAMHQKVVGSVTSANLTDGSGNAAYSGTQYMGIVDARKPRTRIRQLLSSGLMSEKLVAYPQFTGGEGTAGYQVNEGDKKAQADFDWKMVPLLPKTIAVTVDVSKQSMMDISWLSGFLSDHMQRLVLDKEDTEILTGVGGANALAGILPQATAYVPTDSDFTTIYDYLIDAESQLEEKFYYATGILLNPRDYAKMLIRKDDSSSYSHPGLIFGGADRSILTFNGVPIYKSSSLARQTGIIADWGTASLLVREGLSFDISYENKDNFEKNMVTLRMEERVALAMYEPGAFMKVDFSGIATV